MFGSLSDFNGSLFEDFRRMQRDMDQLFGARAWPAGIRAVSRGTFPPINMGATQEKVDIYLYAAGVDSKSLDISIQRNLLTVAGEREVPVTEKGNYYRQERYSGDFRRVITLPEDVDPDQVSANYENGVLHITVQRQVAAGPRQIEVK
jgi:HSP20 family protein